MNANSSCMPNMASVIRNHSTSLLKDHTPADIKECSCHQETENRMSIRQKVFIWISNKTKHYYGTCKKNVKERCNNHAASFRNKNKEKTTELSKCIWELKDNNIQHNLKLRLSSKAHPYACESRKCDLYLTEKLTADLEHY